jgi:1,4-alpha-glucan branching enzyme
MKTSTQPKPSRATRNGREQPAMQTVHFEISNPSARRICLAGTFNDWKPDATEMIQRDGKWEKDIPLSPGTYEYRLVVDGQWMPDPNASQTAPNPFGETNSVITVRSQAGA